MPVNIPTKVPKDLFLAPASYPVQLFKRAFNGHARNHRLQLTLVLLQSQHAAAEFLLHFAAAKFLSSCSCQRNAISVERFICPRDYACPLHSL
jgi:hypothetical protein